MVNTVAVILGGGQGSRLVPLTRYRAKPAVPLGGKYRLVDIAISNCINSHLRRIFLLTQFNSVSLHEHVQDSYRFDPFHYGFVRIMAAQQTPGSNIWFQGTADAVRQCLRYLEEEDPEYILVLSGDQLYSFDFLPLIDEHRERGADITICTTPVPREEAGALGLMQVNKEYRIRRFVEKPGDGPVLESLRAPMYDGELYLASMGIYLFRREVLLEVLDNDLSDFGHDIIPAAIDSYNVRAYAHEGYWRDIGTIGSFWKANLDLTELVPQFTFYDTNRPIFTHMRFLPPSKINACRVDRCLLSEGCILSADSVSHSIVGVRALVGSGSTIEDSILMGADYYERDKPPAGQPPIGIGRDCRIERAIIDKNARIGDGAVISPEGKPDGRETAHYTVRDGVIVIPKNTSIPAGTRL